MRNALLMLAAIAPLSAACVHAPPLPTRAEYQYDCPMLGAQVHKYAARAARRRLEGSIVSAAIGGLVITSTVDAITTTTKGAVMDAQMSAMTQLGEVESKASTLTSQPSALSTLALPIAGTALLALKGDLGARRADANALKFYVLAITKGCSAD